MPTTAQTISSRMDTPDKLTLYVAIIRMSAGPAPRASQKCCVALVAYVS